MTAGPVRLTYLEVFAHLDKLAVGVDVAHAGPLRELYLQTDPRPHFILLNHLYVLNLLGVNQSLLPIAWQKKKEIKLITKSGSF